MRGLFHRYVQIGRVAVINYGPDYGKLCTIVDIIDHNRVLVDGPVNVTGIPRQQYNLRRLAITGLRMKISKGIRQKALTKALKDNKILEKWTKSSWGRKITARKNKDNLNDFQRFVVFLAKAKRNHLVTKKVKELVVKKKKYTAKLKRSDKLKKEGKTLPKSLQKLFERQEKRKEIRAKIKADYKAKLADKKFKPKHHGHSWLLKQKTLKLHKALEKQAEAKHEKNVLLKKRKREKLKSGEKPKEKATTKEKKKTTKKPKLSKEAPKQAPKEAPKVTPKATSKKATPKATTKRAAKK